MAEQQNKTVLTEEGLKKLEAQLDYLVSVRRNEVSEQIAIARGFGDLSENAEYDEAKKEQAKVEEEIVRLTNTIRTAVVVADSEISTEKVSVGTSVRVKDVDTGDEDVYAIVGAGLLGAKRGDVVSIEIPAGILRYEILDITR